MWPGGGAMGKSEDPVCKRVSCFDFHVFAGMCPRDMPGAEFNNVSADFIIVITNLLEADQVMERVYIHAILISCNTIHL